MTSEPMPDYPAEAMDEIRKWIRHWLLRQYGENGHVLPENIKLSEHLAALLDYAERAREAMLWRPIETAPKDGTHILVFPALFGLPLIAAWEKPTPALMMPRAPAVRHDGYWRAALTLKPTPYNPTHWRPLPPAPDSEAKR